MSTLFTILRAAHCRSTHHYFALDALEYVETDAGKRFADLLLKYHDDYLVGAKAPDSSFRDFKNHVLHVADDYWGGAIGACEDWLEETVLLLNERKWKRAAFACGVLSHYFTDPLMPLHTGSCERESLVHRPMEWSICKSYDSIYEAAKRRTDTRFEIPDNGKWIAGALTNGATVSHGHYLRLVEIYDVERGCKRPPEGLNEESRDRLSQIFSMAIIGWARVLDRIAGDAAFDIPRMSLNMATVLASIDFPFAWVVKRISDVAERTAVKKLYREYETTGKLDKRLPSEIRTVRQEKTRDLEERARDLGERRLREERPTRPKRTEDSSPSVQPEASPFKIVSAAPSTTPQSSGQENKPPPRSPAAVGPQQGKEDETEAAAAKPNTGPAPSRERDDDRLEGKANIVDAPSIGPKTAKRFRKIGIHTVEQFLAGSSNEMARKLKTRWITVEKLEEWQAQARLVCEVAGLCGYKAQLLVEAGCLDYVQLSQCEARSLHQQLEQISETSAGRSILRSSNLPDQDEVACWIEAGKDRVAVDADNSSPAADDASHAA